MLYAMIDYGRSLGISTTVDPISYTTATLNAQTSQDSQTYLVVVESSASAPNQNEIVAGVDYNGNTVLYAENLQTTANTPFASNITGLTPNTEYTVYLVSEFDDGEGNLIFSNINSVTFTTLANDNPVISTIDDIVVCEGDIITPVTFTVSDIYPGTALQIDVTSSNQNIILDNSFSVVNNSGNVELTYQIENGGFGQTTVSVTVTDAEGLSSVEQFTVQSSESTAVVTSNGITSVFSNGQDFVVDDAITVQSSQSIIGLRVTIDSYQSGDQLDVSVALPAGVSKSFSSATGVLSITGSMTAAQAQDIFRSVVFSTTSPSLVDRQILFSLGSSIPFAGNDHFYEFVSAPSISFTAAKTAAESRTLYGNCNESRRK
jgi:hypothetical protein